MIHVAIPALDKFRMIGIGLGIDLPTLNSIEQLSNSANDRFANLFDRWLQQDSSNLTWETVFTVLESDIVQRRDLVNVLRKKLQNLQ